MCVYTSYRIYHLCKDREGACPYVRKAILGPCRTAQGVVQLSCGRRHPIWSTSRGRTSFDPISGAHLWSTSDDLPVIRSYRRQQVCCARCAGCISMYVRLFVSVFAKQDGRSSIDVRLSACRNLPETPCSADSGQETVENAARNDLSVFPAGNSPEDRTDVWFDIPFSTRPPMDTGV